MFDCAAFLTAVLKQDRNDLRRFFAEDAVIQWPCTNERFTVEEYLDANCLYPGKWSGEIEAVYRAEDLTVLVTKVSSEDCAASFHCVSFVRCRAERIVLLEEYWAEDGEPPTWRQERKIGRPIGRGKETE